MSIKTVLKKLTSMVLVICMFVSLAAPAVGDAPLPQPTEETVLPDGTTVYADGSLVYADGTIVYADGTTVRADGTTADANGTVVYPDGTMLYADGKMVYADGTAVYPDGTTVYADGTVFYPDGTIVYADGTTVRADGVTVNPDGTTVYPDGTTIYTDGTIVYADGTRAYPDGTVVYADGTTLNPDGSTVYPDGTTVYADGTTLNPDGSTIYPDGTTVYADGTTLTPDGITVYPDGTKVYADGTTLTPDGITIYPDGTTVYTDGTTLTPDGLTVYPDGTTVYADGTTMYADGTTVYPDGTTVYPEGSTDPLPEEEPVSEIVPEPVVPADVPETPEETPADPVIPTDPTTAEETQPATDPATDGETEEITEPVTEGEETENQEAGEQEEDEENKTEETPEETAEKTTEETAEGTTEETNEKTTEETTEQTEEKTAEEAADVAPAEELPLRTLTVSADQMAFRDQFLNPKEPVLWSGSVWSALYGTAIEPVYADGHVTLEISGHLPETVTARAMFVEFADPGAAQNDERALMLLDVALLDETGAFYVPAEALHVSVSDASVYGAVANGEPFAAYFDDAYDGLGDAGDVRVGLDDNIDGDRLAYIPGLRDTLLFWEAGDRLVSTESGTVDFDSNRFPFRFVLSAQQEPREEAQPEVLPEEQNEDEQPEEQHNAVKDVTLSGTLVASDGYTYEISVNYPADCGLPVGAELSVEELIVGTDAYWDYINQSAAELGVSPADLSLARAFDISLVDPATGVHYQPTKDVQVSILLISTPVNTEEEITVLHFDDEAGEVQPMDVALNGEAIEFEANGFSVYTVLQKSKNNNLLAADGTGDENGDGTGEETTPLNTWPENMLSKELTAFNGNLATYQITVNPGAETLTGEGLPYLLKDTFSDNQSINYGSVTIASDPADTVTYDVSGHTGTYTIPDGTAVTITYTTRVSGAVGTEVSFDNTAVVGYMVDGKFVEGPKDSVEEIRTISPTGTDISGTGGVYSIDLFAYADGHMERGLEGAIFRLLDSNMRPMVYLAGANAGEQITFTTGENGTVPIRLDEATDGLSIRKNTVYYLEMTTAPYELLDGEYVYYQRDTTYYSFLITDEPSYTYGNVYSYFNGDVLKVRCIPEAKGVNVTKRFSGNYTLTDEQKNAIRFVLQKEALETESGWVDVESHTYSEFSYGSINFNTGRQGGTELEDFGTYRVIEENALPEDLEGTIERKETVTVSYQHNGVPVMESSNEFSIDPDDKLAFSYDLSFTNEYVDHKLTIIKINEDTGAALPGATFAVYAADNPGTAVETLTTGTDGSITIHRNDAGAGYASDTLYYAVETEAPEGYILPANPEKVYFYFSENGSGVPDGLPAGSTATDLTISYNTVTLSNNSKSAGVPVTVVWGVKGDEPWPEGVNRVVVGLYKSVDGTPAEAVEKDGSPWTLELTKDQYYDAATFVNLPAQEDGKDVVYSVVEKGIYDSSGKDIMPGFAHSSSVSGTGWHVIKNEPAVSVTVMKQWLDQNGDPLSDTSGKAAVSFDLYRTMTEAESADMTREALETFLSGAELVQSGLVVPAGDWILTIDSLQKTDTQGNPYYYYALEEVPDNQEDSYAVAAAIDKLPRTLKITNRQTPVTVNIAVLDAEKTYGDADPTLAIVAEVKEDGASVAVSGPDESGDYTATVTSAGGAASRITFNVSRDPGEDAGVYPVVLSGDALQNGYRVLFEAGTLTIHPAEVTITAGASKEYGEEDPALVSIEGLKGDDTVAYTVSREEGEDVGDYPITLTGETDQGNYRVVFDRSNAVFTITRAPVTVTANTASKQYGEDDPELTATVIGLKRGDEASVLNYDLTRAEGEDVGEYTITPAGDAEQGNYSVTYVPAVFSISTADLTVKVVDAEKSYGDEDPEWEVEIDGLYRDEEGGTLSSVLDEETGVRTYTYTLGEGDEAVKLLTFTIAREAGEGVGSYPVTPDGQETQGNYKLKYESGTLSIERAELFVMADHVVKAVGVETDPLLTATVTGWKNGDDPLEETTLVSEETDEDGTVTRMYRRGTGADEVTFYVISGISENGTVTWTYKRGSTQLLTFTLKRDPGEEDGEYPITLAGEQNQSGYSVEYEQGSFGILSILDVDVKQPVIDYADADAAPSYTYVAKLDLTGTGLTEYEKNGFAPVDGVPTLSFTLPDESKAETVTLKVPGGAKLTVEQTSTDDNYVTAISLDGNPYTNPSNAALCTIEHVDTYHEIAFTHSRISYPVEARVSERQSEDGARKLEGRKGAMGIPTGDDLTRAIDADFADEMNSRIGYVLPTDKYYMYDHASLYTTAGVAIAGASHVSAIKYDRENGKWQYRVGDGSFTDVPENSQLVLFYLPKFVCKIDTEKFYSLKAAVEYAAANRPTATVEMLIGEYTIRSADDAVIIPNGCNITVTTAETEYEGAGTAVISRSMNFTTGHLFYNDGTLSFDNIILDGKGVQASDALVLNRDQNPTLNVNDGATLRNADGNNGGAIYVKSGSVTVNGTLSGNAATYGGAVYVNSGTVTLGGNLSGNSATSGGAVYVNAGEVEINGTVSGNSATSGGAVYLVKGVNNQDSTLTVSGTLTQNEAVNGGAVYQASGTLTVSGSMSENSASSNGGAVYLAGGTLDVEAEDGSLSENTATENGGAVYQKDGELINEGSILGNSAANGGGIFRVGGTITVGGTVSGNVASGEGGGVHSTGGTLNINASLSGNKAVTGGAIYVSGVVLNLNGANIGATESDEGNTASGNGGALYALNSTTVIGGTWSSNKATAGTAASFKDNSAAGNGGALFMEGGSLTVLGASEVAGNSAANGGAIYATSGAITLTSGRLSGNTASSNGGAVYAASASVTVNGATVSSNTATQNNGGAIYAGSGTVTVSGGTISANTATQGNGGAIYADLGTVNFTDGNINGGNSAVNGAAIYVGSGIANVSASITENTASNGGAIGVGGTGARLNFSGNAEVYNNKMGDVQSNVYLDVDSELVINANSLNAGKTIGVYVPGAVTSEQVVKHGDVTGYFGAYVSAGTLANLASVFKNDRFTGLGVNYENNRLYWYKNLSYDIYYLQNYGDSKFPPTTNYTTQSKKVCTNKSYAPRNRESDIYDLVMAMKLYEAHNDDFTKNVGSDYASTAVYAYTFSDKALGNTFANYLKSVRWDAGAHNWVYIKQDGTEAPADTTKLVIFYSAPAYLTITNNNASRMTLNLSELTVLGKDATEGLYGFVTAKNGATVTTLRTLTPDDLTLEAGESIKLMFPGAQGQSFTLKGAFTGGGTSETTAIEYTFNGGAKQTLAGTEVDFSSYKLNTNDEAAEIIFGNALPICKVGNVPFSTLKAAMNYVKAQKTATGSNTYTIEMLVDYLVPKDDVLEIPEGYNITFTTADPDAETLPFTGNGTRATLSRDTGNKDSSVSATKSTLTVNNLAFDGRSLTAGGKGGAVSATNCTTVTITDCEFKGYRADNGGAVYVANTAAGSRLTVERCNFSNCQTNASVDKAGGGGIWTTARELYVRDCTFDSCACLQGSAQAGAVFHNIRSGWSPNSKTEISRCTFKNCFSVGGSGGTIETDALDVTIENCEFHGSYTNKSQGNGGAINALAGDTGSNDGTGWAGSYNGDCWLTVKNCLFDGCIAANNGNGGAIVSSMWYVTLENCKFVSNQSKYGGAVKMTNKSAKWLHINGCTFENCTATDKGGGVYAPVPDIKIEKSDGGTFRDGTENDGNNYFTDCTANRGGGIDNAKDDASVTMENVRFTRCVARTDSGGALYTQAKTLSITGESNTFTDCTGQNSGGAVYQVRNADGSSVTLENCVFTGCASNAGSGNGGGMYANARTLNITGENNGFVNCTANNAGGGLYHDYAGNSVTIANCSFEGCTAKAGVGGGLRTNTQALTITGEKSVFKNCTAQTNGGGLYHDRSATGSSFTFQDGGFENCTATGDYGGAVYSPAKTVTFKDCAVNGSKAKAQGGGVYINPSTASFDGCTITGNSVANSDSKGGGVYIAGGTTTFTNSIVSGCSAANGGGWFQTDGTLYILGGSISGNATNGGGIYQAKGNINQYGGEVAGTATANGGAVYKNSGNYTVGNGTYNNVEYTNGASIGGLITLPAIVNGEETTTTVTSSAVNGGGVYNAGGTLTINAGGSIGSEETGENGETVYTATASGNGGGIYLGGGAVRIYGGVITNCQATGNGGGIYHTSTGNNNDLYFYGADSTAKIQNCLATNGGGVYVNSNTFHMGENGKTSLGTIENCWASTNGGGVYVAGGTFNLRNTSAINGCIANTDGGGVYHAGGTFAFSGGSIIQNSATGNGGGVYHAGDTFSMTNAGAVIGGTEEDANTANIGAGVFVADGQTATFNGSTVTYNRAANAGGGIAVGGPDTVLTFQGTVTVRHNTMGSQNTACNVNLDQNRNTVIKNNALNAGAYIGVYASDEQDEGHGQPGRPFGTYNGSNTGNLNVYHNDRRQYLYGMKGSSNNEVIWPEFVCKITDGEGNLLYKDDSGTPAVYSDLENIIGDNSATNSASAFAALNTAGTPALYLKIDAEQYSRYDGNEYQIQMLVQDYELGSKKQLKLDKNVARKVTLTTASAVEDECGFKYTGDARFAASITRTADTWAMLYVGGTSGWDLTLSNITLDGNEHTANEAGAIMRIYGNAEVTLGDGATLRKGVSTSNNNSVLGGGAVYIHEANGKLVMDAGSKIENSSAGTKNGGGVYLNNGTLTMNGGTISGCFATNGGGVYLTNSGKIEMKGGEITGNNATSQGGGIAINGASASTSFSGYCIVTGNTLNGTTRCNAQFNHDSNTHIYADGLDTRSEIGIYTADSGNNKIYTNHGESGDPFGTWNIDEDNLFCFVNDRSQEKEGKDLRGYQTIDTTDKKIYWEYHPLLSVTKAVNSDLSDDQNTMFSFTVKLPAKTNMPPTERSSITGMSFNANGEATLTLKAGESATAIFPDTFDKLDYEVKEILSDDAAKDYTATAEKNENAYSFEDDKPLTVTGKLGEFVGTENSTSLSEVIFTNARKTGKLTVSKEVISEAEEDKTVSFAFTLTLKDTGISKAYETTKKDSESSETEGTLTFTDGVSETFRLKHGESLTVKGLPTDLEYTVEEKLTDAQRAHIRAQVSKDDSEPVYAVEQKGVIGEKSVTETVDGAEETVYASEVAFTNSFLEIVCKITNRSRALLYYRDAAGNLQPAIFAHLEDAFAQINSGNLRTSGNGTVSGALRIEMVVPEYTMEKTAVLNSGKTVTLSTALPTDAEYPYNKGQYDETGKNTATVYRGFEEGSMIQDSGALTVDKIVLDGGADLDEPITAMADGGIVHVEGTVRLTISSNATLQNSAASGSGGAIWLNSGASLAMNGTISDCSAASGGGIYASSGFTTLTTTGNITGCSATNGGAIYASTGTSVNLNAGTALTGNTATENGGAVYTEANLILRGSVGGTGTGEGNTAVGNGGGIYMGENTTFTMYAGSRISGNTATSGGGLWTQSAARIAGGTLQGNSAQPIVTSEGDEQTAIGGNGGAVYAAEKAAVTISGAAVITENEAAQGGAVYDGSSVTVTGGTMTGNIATGKGGAVYVVEGKTFTMSGGSIKDGNKSPEGALSTGAGATLAFSGNAVVNGNTDSDGTTAKNVYLGYDSNAVITTSGLGSSANIGVYVADGEPEPEGTPNRVDNPIYADHGVGGRDFGTYTGSNLSGARLNKFVNDRDTSLTGMTGTLSGEIQYIAWIGKGLELKVTQYLIQTDDNGNPVLDADGNPVLSEEQVPVQNAVFTFTRVVEGENELQVWSGKSSADGIVTIPWGGSETAGGNVASFVPGSVYRLDQTAAAGNTVLPAGHWKVTIGRDNSVTWEVVSVAGEVDRTLNITLPEKAFLGETFGLKNDVKPTLTYDAMGGKLSDSKLERTDTIAFTTTETSHAYEIRETNPTKESHVFKVWATMKEKPEGENNTELTEEELAAKGYFEYRRNDGITFYRGTDSADPAQKYTVNTSKGDMTLYAQWDAVVCKITDRNGNLLYVNGSPAVYGTLEDGFDAYNADTYFTYSNGGRATARRIEMLVGEYQLNRSVEVSRGKTVMLTTAPKNDTDGYAYTGDDDTVCVITRGGSCDTSMITNNSNLTLMNITLDGGGDKQTVVCDGGIVNNAQSSAVLTIAAGATLRNSVVEGNGGAVMLTEGTRMNMTGGSIVNNTASDSSQDSVQANGGAVYVKRNATMTMTGGTISGNASSGIGGGIYLEYTNEDNYGVLRLSGNPSFGEGNYQKVGEGYTAINGGVTYTQARQDIALTGLGDPDTEISALGSLVVAGTINNAKGSIWVWAEAEGDSEEVNHYKITRQFAVLGANNIPETTLQVFRNARPDIDTDNNTGEFLYGTSEGDVSGYVYWNGVKGSRKVILRKLVGTKYEPLGDRSFTIYKGTAETPYQPKGQSALTGLTSGPSGCFWIGELPYGWYVIKEGDAGPYFYLIITESGPFGTLDSDGKDIIGGYGTRQEAETEAAAKYEQLK